MKRILILSICFVTLFACAKLTDDKRNEIREDLILTKSQQGFVPLGNEFGFNMLKQLSDIDTNPCFISPLCAQLALGMLLIGTDDNTADEIVSTLGFGQNSEETIQYLSSLCNQLQIMDKKTEMFLSNALIINTSHPYRILSSFTQTLSTFQDVTTISDDFRNNTKSVIAKANQWSTEHTKGKIPILISSEEELTKDLVASILNAIYFKSQWSKPFEKKNTRKDLFYPSTGISYYQTMMHQRDWFNFYQDEEKQILQMMYGNGAYCFTVFLPREGVPLQQMTASLNEATIRDIYGAFMQREVILSIPSFAFDVTYDLIPILKSLGIRDVFDSRTANLSKMLNPYEGAHIMAVSQKCSIQVDETGSEATAVTKIDAGIAVAPPNEDISTPVEFRADHPFLYMISEQSSGIILFLGTFTGR